jgi:hypothetical protein
MVALRIRWSFSISRHHDRRRREPAIRVRIRKNDIIAAEVVEETGSDSRHAGLPSAAIVNEENERE